MLLSKEFTFDAAHNLINYHGKCEKLHGHTYRLKIVLEGQDLSQELVPLDVTCSDKLDGEADDLQLTLADPHKIFLRKLPKRGSSISVTLGLLELGRFEIDECTYSSPPSTLKIKATSIPQLSALRQTDESRSWENVKLSKIARDIADASGCEFFFEGFDPDIERAEQGEQSRLAFLTKICADWSLIVKVSDGKLIVYPEEDLERLDSAAELHWSELLHFDAKATLQEVYKEATVNYKHGQHSELYSATANDDSKSEGKTFKVNRRVNSKAEAEHLARHELKKKNKHEFELTLSKRFDARLIAGNSFDLPEEFGDFAGKWLIDEATHSVSRQGSISKCKAHRVQSSS